MDDANTVLLEPGRRVYVGDTELQVRALRRGDKGWQLAFEGHADRVSVEPLRGLDLLTPHRRRLEEDEFWPEDLIGLEAIDERGRKLGTVTDVVFGAAQDRLVIMGEMGTIEVPFVVDLVPVIDVGSGRMEVNWVEGLVSEPPPQR